jgi:hypothetical protein
MPTISELPTAGLLTGAEWVPLEQDGQVKKTTSSAFGGGGGGGGTGDSFTFTQAVPSSSWSIPHGLGRYPSVAVSDSTGRLIEGDVQYLSTNTLTIDFSGAFAGTATCN